METSGAGILAKSPTNRSSFDSVYDWLDRKRADDGAEGLWRIRDQLYDLSKYLNDHPGGKYWLEITKGTDITEAFESHHISDKAEKILAKFYVREAKSPRNSLITFRENGFFRTLKRKIRDGKLVESTKPLTKTKISTDAIAVAVFASCLLATIYDYRWAALSGVLLNMLAVSAHNFFHMKDNWRMYYFNMSLMSFREWRISHALSHHMYPNTALDLEITMLEPLLRFFPDEKKTLRYLSWVFSPLVMAFVAHFQFVRRISKGLFLKNYEILHEELAGLVLPTFLLLFSGQGFWRCFVSWQITVVVASFAFGLIGLTAAHHHPDIYHDGDFLGNDKDFGILQLAAVRNRVKIDGNFLLTLVTFGEHALHHLFPIVDHGRLPELNAVFEETCRQFGIDFKPFTSTDLFIGMFRQLIRNYKNSKLFIMNN